MAEPHAHLKISTIITPIFKKCLLSIPKGIVPLLLEREEGRERHQLVASHMCQN